ncbi:hypothetical protein [Magnetospirillum sp. UT-4]|uniref:hypothetical protein n=1 Tax=Magnetospirillum sp. UT-4 TaxID=2681467 RepID=UPI00137F78E9|nr:hypothetical protein [Magnetospirillum sp. UT-4]CAA7622789.1 conserved hypothetical protein [Magnetospirillum sp. UT-4]
MALRARKPAEPPGRPLWRQMAVRHRAPGHLRFDLPAPLCSAAAADIIEAGLSRLDGVTRVTVFTASRKLSIRWIEELCPTADVVRTLAAIVDGIGVPLPTPAAPAGGVVGRLKRAVPLARWRARYADLKAKASVLSQIIAIKTGRKPPLPAEAADWAINFANDLVVFYLVRLHWQRITTMWLPNPWTYRTQWLAVIYLTFLLVRYRKARKAQAEAEPPPPCCGG